jgi:5-methylcytosine-specific restriction endonuclease McrA
MKTNHGLFTDVTDHELLVAVQRLAGDERRVTARLIASLAELDARRLYLGEGCSSLFTYCTQVLRLSEHASYGRIEAARAARRFPVILDRLAGGDITLTAIGLLAPHLTVANHCELLDAARHRSKREVEHLVARLRPQPSVSSTVRKLPSPTQSIATSTAPPLEMTLSPEPRLPSAPTPQCQPPARPAVIRPLAPERYKIQFTASAETFDKLRSVQDLMRHGVPDGDVAVIFDRALTLLLGQLERSKLAAAQHPRPQRGKARGSRRIPAVVRRQVWERDEGQCAFIGARGRCTERGLLEFHHVVPFAAGGQASADNIELRCRPHNQHEADMYFIGQSPPLVREVPESLSWMTTRSRTELRQRPISSIRSSPRGRATLASLLK